MIKIQIITILKSTTNIQIYHFKTIFHILHTLPTYKYMTSKQYSCVQGPLRECRLIRSCASRLPYYCTPPLCVPAVLGGLAVWHIFTLTWQFIVMNQIQLEFMAVLTVSLSGAHIRIEDYVCAGRDLKVIKKIDWVLSTLVSPWCDKWAEKQYLVESMCQCIEPLLLSWSCQYYAELQRAMLLCWVTCSC